MKPRKIILPVISLLLGKLALTSWDELILSANIIRIHSIGELIIPRPTRQDANGENSPQNSGVRIHLLSALVFKIKCVTLSVHDMLTFNLNISTKSRITSSSLFSTLHDSKDMTSVWCAPDNIVLRFTATVTRICGVLNTDAIVTVHILILVLKVYVGTDNGGTPIWQIAQNNSLRVRVRVPFSNNIRNARSLYSHETTTPPFHSIPRNYILWNDSATTRGSTLYS
ncbi:hypothetical protein AGLY_002919, partial [Aphis glycines]